MKRPHPDDDRPTPPPVAHCDDPAALRIDGAWTRVNQLRPGLKHINTVVIMLEAKGAPVQGAQGSIVQTWLVADETGSVEMALYDQHVAAFAGGNILRLLNGYSSLHRGQLRLYVGAAGQLRRVGDFTMRYSEQPNMSNAMDGGHLLMRTGAVAADSR